jgi:hypothetical protein
VLGSIDFDYSTLSLFQLCFLSVLGNNPLSCKGYRRECEWTGIKQNHINEVRIGFFVKQWNTSLGSNFGSGRLIIWPIKKLSRYRHAGDKAKRRYSSYSFLTSALNVVSGQHHASATLYHLVNYPGTHWIGGWVGLRAGLDAEARGKILYICRGPNAGRLVCSQALYWLGYRGFVDNLWSWESDFSGSLPK